MGDGEGLPPLDHSAALSWRDVYRAVGETEERIIKVIKESTGPLRVSLDDHEMRLRKIELEGSAEAKEAVRASQAIGVKLDAVSLLVNANTAARRGMFDTLSAGQRVILFTVALIGATSVLLDIFSKYFGGS